jgi:2-keto-3-deoxy-L-rhamnonate aldolase RhmA
MKERLAAGETLFGTFLSLGSPLAAEALGLAGFDWLLVDLEHGGGHESQLLGQVLGARAGGAHALARVESAERSRTTRVLDLGVEGVMCPQVSSAEAGEAWAGALHYGPQGTRGIALYNRGARYGTDPDAIETARRTTLGVAQIESPEAVADVEGIAAASAPSTTRSTARRSRAWSAPRTPRARPRGSSSAPSSACPRRSPTGSG